MKRTLSLAIVSALLLPLAARAQSATAAPPPTAQQPAPSHDPFEDDPVFKSLPPEQQELVRKVMQNTKAAIDTERNKPSTPPKAAPAIPPVPPLPTGCAVAPVKTPKFHLPKPIQDAINKQVKQVGKQTGVNLDPNAPAQAVNGAQKNTPCPPAAKPANQ